MGKGQTSHEAPSLYKEHVVDLLLIWEFLLSSLLFSPKAKLNIHSLKLVFIILFAFFKTPRSFASRNPTPFQLFD